MANRVLPSALIGWPLLPVPDAHGRLDYPTLDESVRQSIQVILRTRPGEQLMRPTFGAGLEGFLHEPNTIATRRRIRDLITESLERWEQRIILSRVEVAEVPQQPTQIRVEVAYQLRRTGALRQMGLTMELET
ncbi:MAG TPA: GPW/gp25 family protein [Pyrinomonadaceae bacterium]|nr:GPW/gp25 family protein [Pyrinomonadaceae bacterium]